VVDTGLMGTIFRRLRHFVSIAGLLIFVAGLAPGIAEPSTQATAAFNAYINVVESRLAKQHQTRDSFLAPRQNETLLQHGELIIEPVPAAADSSLPGALLHDWRGTAFAAGAKAADFDRLMRDISAYPQRFSPQVLQARLLMQRGDHLQAFMRIRQHHVLTVVLDTTYDIMFGHLDEHHGYSISRSLRISEIGSPGTGAEHVLGPDEEHGFLWRLNTYWTYEERDGGLYMQIESVSLTRSIPTGLKWVVEPFVQKIPRDSLEFTLRAVCNALRK
jgi:hypothetical protein